MYGSGAGEGTSRAQSGSTGEEQSSPQVLRNPYSFSLRNWRSRREGRADIKRYWEHLGHLSEDDQIREFLADDFGSGSHVPDHLIQYLKRNNFLPLYQHIADRRLKLSNQDLGRQWEINRYLTQGRQWLWIAIKKARMFQEQLNEGNTHPTAPEGKQFLEDELKYQELRIQETQEQIIAAGKTLCLHIRDNSDTQD